MHPHCKHCSAPHTHTRPAPTLFQPLAKNPTAEGSTAHQEDFRELSQVAKPSRTPHSCPTEESHLQPVKQIQGMLTCFFSQGNWGSLLKMSQSSNY